MQNNFKIIKKIGSGSFSNCFLCRNNSNIVAVKKSICSRSFEGIKACEIKEIYCLLKLKDHPNVIPLQEISINNNNEYILIMKYVKLTLDKFIYFEKDRSKYLVSFINQMLSVIHYMHCNNIVHTDIKPNNILVEYVNNYKDIKIYIIDFGSAYVENISQKYSIVTTYTTRAPEVFNFDYKYDKKIDIWSFGMVLYYFISGKEYIDYTKYDSNQNLEILKHLYDIQSNILQLFIDDKLRYFLLKILIINPEIRPDTYKIINIFEDLFSTRVSLINFKNNNSNNNFIVNKKLLKLNTYISSRLNYINLNNLIVAESIIKKLDSSIHNSKTENEILFLSWFICYQFVHSDVDYDLHDFLPVFNSYCNKFYNARQLSDSIYDILDNINFNII